MDLKIPYAQVTDKSQAFEGTKKLLPSLLNKFGVTAQVEADDVLFSLKAKGSGFEAQIHFHETEAEVRLNLGLLLKPFKGKILETLEKQIKKIV